MNHRCSRWWGAKLRCPYEFRHPDFGLIDEGEPPDDPEGGPTGFLPPGKERQQIREADVPKAVVDGLAREVIRVPGWLPPNPVPRGVPLPKAAIRIGGEFGDFDLPNPYKIKGELPWDIKQQLGRVWSRGYEFSRQASRARSGQRLVRPVRGRALKPNALPAGLPNLGGVRQNTQGVVEQASVQAIRQAGEPSRSGTRGGGVPVAYPMGAMLVSAVALAIIGAKMTGGPRGRGPTLTQTVNAQRVGGGARNFNFASRLNQALATGGTRRIEVGAGLWSPYSGRTAP